MTQAAKYFLTRTAALDLRNIYTRYRKAWGEAVADRYLSDLYAGVRLAAKDPETGRLRRQRSAPFLMLPARQHFIIYDSAPQGVIVLTVQHQVRDIQALIVELTPAFLAEVDRIKTGAN